MSGGEVPDGLTADNLISVGGPMPPIELTSPEDQEVHCDRLDRRFAARVNTRPRGETRSNPPRALGQIPAWERPHYSAGNNVTPVSLQITDISSFTSLCRM